MTMTKTLAQFITEINDHAADYDLDEKALQVLTIAACHTDTATDHDAAGVWVGEVLRDMDFDSDDIETVIWTLDDMDGYLPPDPNLEMLAADVQYVLGIALDIVCAKEG